MAAGPVAVLVVLLVPHVQQVVRGAVPPPSPATRQQEIGMLRPVALVQVRLIFHSQLGCKEGVHDIRLGQSRNSKVKEACLQQQQQQQ